MNNLIFYALYKYYKQNNSVEYLDRCREKYHLHEEIIEFATEKTIVIEEVYKEEIWPSSKYIFKLPPFMKGDFSISYRSILTVSKLCPVYFLQHEFEMENLDPHAMSPTLDGFDRQPYTMLQQELETIITNQFTEDGFHFLSFKEVNEVLCNFNIDKQIDFFGAQVTVEQALFYDLLDLCPNE